MIKIRKIFLLVGPSGSGKTTLGEYLKKISIPELVSHTTRKIRNGEVNGKTYYYTTKEEFDKTEKIEYSEYAGNYYCLSKDEVENKLNKHKQVFAIVDINGARQIKKIYPKETVSIFIEVTFDEMFERMKERGDSKKDIAKRISNAILNDELSNYDKCDYVIRNEYFETAKQSLKQIIKLESIDF